MAQANIDSWKDILGGGAAGVGTVLVLIPLLAVIYRMVEMDGSKAIGLPILAILGIMILLGTLALVALLFQRLDLADRTQPLGLPQGSMRAVIALSLIVLFAIISITLYRTTAKGAGSYQLGGLTIEERNALVVRSGDRVQEISFDHCLGQANTSPSDGQEQKPGVANESATFEQRERLCAQEQRRYTIQIRVTPTPESTDLAKQLLVLIGTLMTSVTSFYFAARSKHEERPDSGSDPTQAQAPSNSIPVQARNEVELDAASKSSAAPTPGPVVG